MKRILAIGAHPDDVELGCAGLLQKPAVKNIVVLSAGERGSSLDRCAEARKAAERLEANISIYSLEDTKITISEVIPILEQQILEFKPDILLTQAGHDTHQDHRAVYEATRVAIRKTKCTALSYMGPSCSEGLQPNWFIGLTEEQMRTKIDICSIHKSQQHNSYVQEEYLFTLGKYWSLITRATLPYVEPYKLIQHWE